MPIESEYSGGVFTCEKNEISGVRFIIFFFTQLFFFIATMPRQLEFGRLTSFMIVYLFAAVKLNLF